MGSDRSQMQKDEVQMIPVTGVSQSFFSLKVPDRSHLGEGKDVGSWFLSGTQTSMAGECAPQILTCEQRRDRVRMRSRVRT